jgi:uncharacterized membrane protein
MAIDNQFRIDELISKGSRAIVSKDEVTGNHTFVQGSKEVVNEPYPHLKGERDGEQVGTIEKPKYNEEELVKAVDTKVDELIGPPKKEKPPVVPKPLYDDLRRLYDLRGVRINELETQVSNLESIISQLEAQIESLQIELDAARLQQTVAENQSQQINEQYVALLQDFSSAVIKSTKEGIERVSLKAQTEGLIAQKESLREQLKALNSLVGTLQSQLSGAAAESSAAAAGLTPGSDNEFFYGVTKTGKIDPVWDTKDIGWTTSATNAKTSGNAGDLNIQNLRDDGVSITKLQIVNETTGGIPTAGGILGFTDGRSPAKSKTVDIGVGVKESFPIYFNVGIGGRNKPEPDSGGWFDEAKNYSGTWKIKVTYSDGGTADTGTISWGIRKNKG